MPDSTSSPVTLSFADGDDLALPDARPRWRLGRLARRIECWREHRLIRNALELAGDPTLVLDLSRATGRYWPVLAEHPSRVIVAAADSAVLAEASLHRQPQPIRERIRVLQATAFAFGLPDGAVDCVFCMQPLDGISQRAAFLHELHRVTRDTVILAAGDDDFDRFQQEIAAASFSLIGCFGFLPLWSAWRIAILRKIELAQGKQHDARH